MAKKWNKLIAEKLYTTVLVQRIAFPLHTHTHRFYTVVVCLHVCANVIRWMHVCVSVCEHELASKRVSKQTIQRLIAVYVCVYLWSDSMVVFITYNYIFVVSHKIFGYDTIIGGAFANRCFISCVCKHCCSLFSYMRFRVDVVYMCTPYTHPCARKRRKTKNFVCVWVRLCACLFHFYLYFLFSICFWAVFYFIFSLFLFRLHRLLLLLFSLLSFYSKIIAAGYFDTSAQCFFLSVLLWPLVLLIVVTICLKIRFSLHFFWGSLDSILCIHFAYQAIIYCGSLHRSVCVFLSSTLF